MTPASNKIIDITVLNIGFNDAIILLYLRVSLILATAAVVICGIFM